MADLEAREISPIKRVIRPNTAELITELIRIRYRFHSEQGVGVLSASVSDRSGIDRIDA